MKKVLKSIFAIAMLLSLALGVFALLNSFWNFRMQDPAQKLTLSRCPVSSQQSWNDYISKEGRIQQEVRKVEHENLTYEEEAQRYEGLLVELEDLSYPRCAAFLQETLHNSIQNYAQASAAEAKGGILGRIRHEYYREKAVKNMYLLSFIATMLEPPSHFPNWRFTA